MYRLEEVIDIPGLQRLMDLFHAATAFPVGILDRDGTILVATGWQSICTRFHRLHPSTASRCRESDDYINSHLPSEGYVQYKCKNGLWDVAVPIVIGGEHVGTLFFGQFFYDDETVDVDFFRRLGTECGFDLAEYLAALAAVPVLGRKQVADVLAYYASFVGFLAETGLARLKRQEAEQQLAARAAELEAANRDLESFGYTLSHDLRNPISRILFSAGLLQNEFSEALGEKGRKFTGYICEAAETMNDVVTSLLNLSRLARRELDRTEIDLGELARTVALELRVTEPERRVEFVLEPKLSVRGDAPLLKLALENLMGNAWKYTATVTDARIWVGGGTVAGERVFFVADNGVGFPMEDACKLFQPFQRLHRDEDFAGSGIGLATVQRIVHRHGGRIWAEGASGSGGIFYFTLP